MNPAQNQNASPATLRHAVRIDCFTGYEAMSGMDRTPSACQIAIGEWLKSVVPRSMGAQNGPAIIAPKTSTRSATLIESGTWLVAVQPENKQPRATGQRYFRTHVRGCPGKSACEARRELGMTGGSPSRIAPSASFPSCMGQSRAFFHGACNRQAPELGL